MLAATDAVARFKDANIEAVVEDAIHIVDATIVSSKLVEWYDPSGYRSCGFESFIRVNENLSGNLGIQTVIGSSELLEPGQRYLLFLKNHEGDFIRDAKIIWPADIQAKIDECLAKLPLLKSNWRTTSQVIEYHGPFLLLSNFMTSPLQLRDKEITFEVETIKFDRGTTKILESDLNCSLLEKVCLKRTIFLWEEFRRWLKEFLENKANKSLNADAGDAGAG